MKWTPYHLLGILLAFCLFAPLQAQDTELTALQLYIGFERNHQPYTYLDDKQQAQGILVDAMKALCTTAKVNCVFVAGNFDKLMEDVQTFQLSGLLVIDTFFFPEIDKVKFTSPFCTFNPVFIQKQSAKNRQSPQDFKGAMIGVREGSLLHLHILDTYSSVARLKSYPLLEAGVFDLISGRTDVLFADNTFFKQRILNTPLGNTDTPSKLVAYPLAKLELPATSMRLAVRAQDTKLLETLEKALHTTTPPPDCADLPTKQPLPTASKPAANP
ncbi:substrate-binding periplasmic protein [Thiothrix lacustris]|uniref:substrate-binding periplasmic protein n=1 Tax=Thiothrix lacustris TaxID=525917 RepID=UPI0027E4B325|nr:transporter substrate-binding domain-containing protein [Thiothrix lacustris]WMP19408.1 transporter substrate-binding domain-containing protein [Thiothrix lacustris]